MYTIYFLWYQYELKKMRKWQIRKIIRNRWHDTSAMKHANHMTDKKQFDVKKHGSNPRSRI